MLTRKLALDYHNQALNRVYFIMLKKVLYTEAIENIFKLAPSKKHMIGRELGRLEPTPSLKYKAKACASV